MLAHPKQQIQTARALLKSGTPEQYAAVVPVLERLAETLDVWMRKEGIAARSAESTAFVIGLQTELRHLRHLLEAPLHFFAGRERAGTAGFGSYERNGTLQPLVSGRRFLAQL